MNIKNCLKILFTKADKNVVENNMEIDYHFERNYHISDYSPESSYMYPSKYVCKVNENEPMDFFETKLKDDKESFGYLLASNRFPKRLKKDKILPEYILMIILTAIITLPYSLVTGLMYILRRGHFRISYNIHKKHMRFAKNPIMPLFDALKKVLMYGLASITVFIISMKHIYKIDNGWAVFCDAARRADFNFPNIVIALIFIAFTGILVLGVVDLCLVPVFFFQKNKTFVGGFLGKLRFIIFGNTDPDDLALTTSDKREILEFIGTDHCCIAASLFMPFSENSYELYHYKKHAYAGELTWRFISPFAYRYYCMAHGYYIPMKYIIKRNPIAYSIFYKANPMTIKNRTAKYFTNF